MEVRFGHVEYKTKDIGPNLLESITKGLYINPLHVIREYVQNEVESNPPPTEVKIRIEGGNISIWGNGGGMNREELEVAKRIGFSTKDPEEFFGFRGIGLWSGISVCETVLMTTKRRGSNKKYFLKIDADGIRKEIENRVDKPLVKVLTDHVMMSEAPAPINEHGTHVQLINILDEDRGKLLSFDEVKNYLDLTLPVGLSPKFKCHKQVEKMIREHVPDYKTYKIYLNEELLHRPPYLKNVDPPQPLLLRNKAGKLIAFCWICPKRSRGVIRDLSSRGLIYKKKGFTVGDRETCLSWWKKSKNLMYWVTGEIHVINPKLLPDSERTDFESGPAKDVFVSELQKVLKTVEELSRRKSFIERFEEKIEALREMPQSPVFSSQEDKEEKISEITEGIRGLRRDLKNSYIKFVPKLRIGLAKRVIEASKRIRERYRQISISEVEKKAEIPPTPIRAPTRIPVRIIQKERIPTISLVDLVRDLKLSRQLRVLIEIIEQSLDGYFEDDLEACSELKHIIAAELRKISK